MQVIEPGSTVEYVWDAELTIATKRFESLNLEETLHIKWQDRHLLISWKKAGQSCLDIVPALAASGKYGFLKPIYFLERSSYGLVSATNLRKRQ